MDAIINLVDQATHELEKINNMADMVGNRPHFPMFIASNLSSAPIYAQLHRKMELAWPQSASKLVFSAYTTDKKETVQLKSTSDNANIGEEQMQALLDEIKFSRETFESMSLWCIYNIIDTSSISTIDEFKNLFNSIDYLKRIVVDSSRTLLIVVLDDSAAKREIAKEIKAYLSAGIGDYDGAFIISNRTQNNELHRTEEVYRIVTNVMILSNNDAVAIYDNDAYTTRVACFYNKRINTVSYSLLERPNRKIAIQLIDTIIQYTKNKSKTFSESLDQHEWRKRLGIGNRIDVCEEHLKKAQVNFDVQSLQYLPMKSGDGIDGLDINKTTFAQFKALTFEGVLEQFIENYYKTELLNDANITHCVDAFEQKLKDTIPSPTFASLRDDIVESIFAQLEEGSVSASLTLNSYIKEQMLSTIRKSIVYPKCQEVIKTLKLNSIRSTQEFSKVQADFMHSIPLSGFDDIGTIYKTITENYLNSPNGESDIAVLLTPGSTYNDILKFILQTVRNIINYNKSDFSLSFVEEWEKRLNLVGDTIYREIYSILDENSRSRIHLFGSFPIEEKLQVYMFHTTDAKGESNTELYNHLHQAYKDVFGTQFFNTGSDDSLEVIKVIDCTGDKLKL